MGVDGIAGRLGACCVEGGGDHGHGGWGRGTLEMPDLTRQSMMSSLLIKLSD